jgi:hypothetical protein
MAAPTRGGGGVLGLARQRRRTAQETARVLAASSMAAAVLDLHTLINAVEALDLPEMAASSCSGARQWQPRTSRGRAALERRPGLGSWPQA